MRPDQERVRNLLMDTVSLLCKNSIQFKDKLQVEGLLGVSVDKNDVFFVHISKEFTNSPSECASVPHDTTDTRDERAHPPDADSGDSSQLDFVNVKLEAEATSNQDESRMVQPDPNVELEGVATPVQMVAGRRRAPKRTCHSGGSISGHNMDNEPVSKRQARGHGSGDMYDDEGDNSFETDSYSGEGDDSGGDDGQGWPIISDVSGFDPSQTFHDNGNSQTWITDSLQQPSWTAGPSDSKKSQSSTAKQLSKERQKLKRIYMCGVCEKTFNIRAHLTDHLRTHTGDKPFVCSMCGKRFNQKGMLTRHEKTHGNYKHIPCTVCTKKFREEGNMIKHVKKQHPEVTPPRPSPRKKPNADSQRPKTIFFCHTCGKIFSNKKHLEEHLRIHTGEKPFACTKCGKKFSQMSTLGRHEKTHGNTKHVPCIVCPKKFREERNMIKHVKEQHPGVTPPTPTPRKYVPKPLPKEPEIIRIEPGMDS